MIIIFFVLNIFILMIKIIEIDFWLHIGFTDDWFSYNDIIYIELLQYLYVPIIVVNVI